MFIFISSSKCLNYVISHAVRANARYSASVDDLETVCCFFVCQETKLSSRYMANPVVDLRVDGQEVQSESEKSLIPEVLDFDEKKSPRPGEFLIYIRTLFTFLCLSSIVGFAIC